MDRKRRHIIAAAGMSTLAIVSGAGWWRVTRMPLTATKPWEPASFTLTDIRLDAFRHAILAPNPHNRQPWLIKLDGLNSALVHCDLDKRLPETDPFDRQITIGFGSFLELARIAAAESGYRIDMTLFPEGEPQPRLDRRPIARLDFIADSTIERDALYPAIIRRRSNKGVYDLSKSIPELLANKIAGVEGNFIVDAARVAAIRPYVLEALAIEQNTRRTYLESVRLIRIGHDQVDANPDGIDLTGPLMETLKLLGQLDQKQLADPESSAFKSGFDSLTETYGSIPAMIWIVTPDNSRRDQIEAGRRYVRTNLRATLLGVGMHPMSQSLQEYTEVALPYANVHKILAATGSQRVQMLARIGYVDDVAPAPRWPMEHHLIND